MKQFSLTAFYFLMMATMHAQTPTSSPAGEYYLTGVMETASGFRLKADSSFEFFFSYGALDREAAGSWKQEGEHIIFNSPQTNANDYSLVRSGSEPGKGLRVRITGASEHIRKMVRATVVTDGSATTASADATGLMNFDLQHADTISLVFEWCAEKQFRFVVTDTTHNYFEFKFEPSLMDVLFDNFQLRLTADGFEGPHPLDTTKTFTYSKAAKKSEN